MARHVIVIGNEKGGSGKSTAAIHLIVALLREGKTVAALDLDVGQETLSRYLENRRNFAEARKTKLPMPLQIRPELTDAPGCDPEAEIEKLTRAVEGTRDIVDVLVIDCPGRDGFLSRAGHSFADTLITPLNDSFIDLDVLARVDGRTMKVQGPSRYAEMVWEQRKRKLVRDRGQIDWIVMRNRLSHLSARNKQNMGTALKQLSSRMAFRMVAGFGERVIFRELFLNGLTVLDLHMSQVELELNMSQVAARHEVRALMQAVRLG